MKATVTYYDSDNLCLTSVRISLSVLKLDPPPPKKKCYLGSTSSKNTKSVSF